MPGLALCSSSLKWGKKKSLGLHVAAKFREGRQQRHYKGMSHQVCFIAIGLECEYAAQGSLQYRDFCKCHPRFAVLAKSFAFG